MNRGVLVFDGDCGFCTSSVLWAQRRKLLDDVDVIAWQTADLSSLGLTPSQTAESVWFVSADGERLAGADAVAAILRLSRQPYRGAGQMMQLSGMTSVSRWVYGLVARNRHRLPGATEACAVNHDA